MESDSIRICLSSVMLLLNTHTGHIFITKNPFVSLPCFLFLLRPFKISTPFGLSKMTVCWLAGRFLLVLFYSQHSRKISLLVAQDKFAAKTPVHFQRNPRFNQSRRQSVHQESRSVYNKTF